MSIASDIIREHTDTIILSALLLRDSYGYEINKKIKSASAAGTSLTRRHCILRLSALKTAAV